MIEIFKKPEEEQKNAEQGTAEPREKPEENKNEETTTQESSEKRRNDLIHARSA